MSEHIVSPHEACWPAVHAASWPATGRNLYPLDPAVASHAAASGATDLSVLDTLIRYVRDEGLFANFVLYPMKSAQNYGSGATVAPLGGLTSEEISLVNSPTWGAGSLDFEGATSYAVLDAPWFESITSGNGYLGIRFLPRVASAADAINFDCRWSFGEVTGNNAIGVFDATGLLASETITTVNPGANARTGSTSASWTAGEDMQEVCVFGTFGSNAAIYKNKTAYTMNVSTGAKVFVPASTGWTTDDNLVFSGRRATTIGGTRTGKYIAVWACNTSLTTTQRETITDLINAL